jgi:hypothetical protein
VANAVVGARIREGTLGLDAGSSEHPRCGRAATIAAVRVEEMTFLSDGVVCAARVYRPDPPPTEGTPCIVMANGFR